MDFVISEDQRNRVGPEDSYQNALARLMAFQEPAVERMRRLDEGWRRCDLKGPRTALEFQRIFERLITELAPAGLRKSENVKFLIYIFRLTRKENNKFGEPE